MKTSEKNSVRNHLSEIKVSYRKNNCFPDFQVTCSSAGEKILRRLYDVNTINLYECFYALFLDHKNNVIGYYQMSHGGYNATLIETKLLYSIALLTGCQGLILSHNHPSGNLKPSNEDLRMTEKVISGARLLDIAVFDHIILSSDSYFSFGDNGLLS